MRRGIKWGLGASALALTLALAACTENSPIQWPGMSRPDQTPDTPTPPVDPVDTGDTSDTPDTGPDTPVDVDPDTGTTDTPPVTDPVDEPTDEPSDPPTGDPVDETPDTPTDEPVTDPVDEPTEPDTDPEPPVIAPPTFSYNAPGVLLAGSGDGAVDETVYAPDMVFPIKDAAAYPQSMVWGFGGGIGGGDECDTRNYAYPWRDNFCEKRSSNYNTAFCPSARVHLGQDIRVGTPQGCEDMRRTDASQRALYKVVAAEDGIISNIGSYTVNVRTSGGRIYRYLHMNMRALQVSLDETVTAGQTLGYVSKDFGGHATTFHLHFEIKQNTAEHGWAYVPPYLSLVEAYERREGGPGERIVVGDFAVASEPIPIPEDFVFTE